MGAAFGILQMCCRVKLGHVLAATDVFSGAQDRLEDGEIFSKTGSIFDPSTVHRPP
jgi:hypothetical protein